MGLILENELTSNCDNEMDEVLHSKRIVIPSIVYKGNPELGTFVMPPVKTSESIPKELIPNVLEEIKKCKINGPHDIGDVIISNVCGTGADIIATKKIFMGYISLLFLYLFQPSAQRKLLLCM